jgi:hypothetical protein
VHDDDVCNNGHGECVVKGEFLGQNFLHLVFIVSLQAHLHLDTVITILFSRKKTFLLKERNFCLIVKIPFGFFLIDYNK